MSSAVLRMFRLVESDANSDSRHRLKEDYVIKAPENTISAVRFCSPSMICGYRLKQNFHTALGLPLSLKKRRRNEALRIYVCATTI